MSDFLFFREISLKKEHICCKNQKNNEVIDKSRKIYHPRF